MNNIKYFLFFSLKTYHSVKTQYIHFLFTDSVVYQWTALYHSHLWF